MESFLNGIIMKEDIFEEKNFVGVNWRVERSNCCSWKLHLQRRKWKPLTIISLIARFLLVPEYEIVIEHQISTVQDKMFKGL